MLPHFTFYTVSIIDDIFAVGLLTWEHQPWRARILSFSIMIVLVPLFWYPEQYMAHSRLLTNMHFFFVVSYKTTMLYFSDNKDIDNEVKSKVN